MKHTTRKLTSLIMNQVNQRLPHGSFGRKVFIMLTGTAAGQMITVLLSPALTRIFTPGDMGELGAFSAILMIFAVVAMLRYEQALPLTKDKVEESNLLVLCFLILAFLTCALSISLYAFMTEEIWSRIFTFSYSLRWLLPIGFFVVSAYQTFAFLATKQEDFKSLSKTKLYQGVAGPVSQIAMGLYGLGAFGLLIGFIIGQSTGISILYAKLVAQKDLLKETISIASLKAVAKRFNRFPLVSLWSALLGILSSRNIIFLIVPILYSPAIGGLVFITDRVVARPLMLLTTSIMQVYAGDVAKSLQQDRGSIKARFIKLFVQQFVVVGGWLILINVSAPFIFPVVFGEEWGAAVPYLHVLSISYLAQMIMIPLFQSLQSMELHGRTFAWQVLHTGLVFVSFALSYIWQLSALDGLLFYSLASTLAYVILFFIILYSVQGLSDESADKSA